MTSKWRAEGEAEAEGEAGAAEKGDPGRGNSKYEGDEAGASWIPRRNSKEQEWLGQSDQGRDRGETQGQGGKEMGADHVEPWPTRTGVLL